MAFKDRLEQIVALLNESGYHSVGELSQLCQVSEMTIRRDLDRLEKGGRVKRTYGGAAPLGGVAENGEPGGDGDKLQPAAARPVSFLVDRVDVLIATSVNPAYDSRLLESIARKRIPIIAELMPVNTEEPVVAVDNYQAGLDVGRWAGGYARERWQGRAVALDLTYSLSNTQARSRGFAAGLRETLPDADVILSINAQSRAATAYQLTKDALSVHPEINLIFAINDSTAWGAMNACRDLRIDPANLIVLPFGLEGDTLKNALMEGSYCKAGLAQFPEIVGTVCMQAAIAAYQNRPLPAHLITPHVMLTAETLPEYYTCQGSRWQLRGEAVHERFSTPLGVDTAELQLDGRFPRRIGFIVPFSEHEWYKSLIVAMQSYASQLKIDFEVIDADQNLRDEIDIRRRLIAREAAREIQAGEAVLMDDGPIACYLAEELLERKDITVITNSLGILDILRQNANIGLIVTGGLTGTAARSW